MQVQPDFIEHNGLKPRLFFCFSHVALVLRYFKSLQPPEGFRQMILGDGDTVADILQGRREGVTETFAAFQVAGQRTALITRQLRGKSHLSFDFRFQLRLFRDDTLFLAQQRRKHALFLVDVPLTQADQGVKVFLLCHDFLAQAHFLGAGLTGGATF